MTGALIVLALHGTWTLVLVPLLRAGKVTAAAATLTILPLAPVALAIMGLAPVRSAAGRAFLTHAYPLGLLVAVTFVERLTRERDPFDLVTVTTGAFSLLAFCALSAAREPPRGVPLDVTTRALDEREAPVAPPPPPWLRRSLLACVFLTGVTATLLASTAPLSVYRASFGGAALAMGPTLATISGTLFALVSVFVVGPGLRRLRAHEERPGSASRALLYLAVGAAGILVYVFLEWRS